MASNDGVANNGNSSSGILPYIVAGASAGFEAITKGGPKRQYKYNKKLAQLQNKMNRENAIWALEQNKALLAEQRAYDSPEQQMARYRAAGLNPNLIYGQVAQSPGDIRVGSLPGVNTGAIDASYPDVAGAFRESMLAQSQMGLTEAKTEESYAKQDVLNTQNEVLKANPYLRPQYVDSIVKNMESIATLKAQEADFMSSKSTPDFRAEEAETRWQRGYLKMQRELDALAQKYELGKQDQKVKAEIIENKKFQNDLAEIQRSWMKDGEITPEHIRQGIMMLLGKFR